MLNKMLVVVMMMIMSLAMPFSNPLAFGTASAQDEGGTGSAEGDEAPWPLVSIEVLNGMVDFEDFSSPVDAFVRLFIDGNETGQTRADWDTKRPKWNKKFRVNWLHPKSRIEFQIFDYDLFSKDDYIGRTNTTLEHIMSSGKLGEPVKLKFRYGFIFIRMTVVSLPNCGLGPNRRTSAYSRIKGGKDAEDAEFPWQVSLQKIDPQTNHLTHFCGATIINTRYIVTAAHCVARYGIISNSFSVLVGFFGQDLIAMLCFAPAVTDRTRSKHGSGAICSSQAMRLGGISI